MNPEDQPPDHALNNLFEGMSTSDPGKHPFSRIRPMPGCAPGKVYFPTIPPRVRSIKVIKHEENCGGLRALHIQHKERQALARWRKRTSRK